MKLNKFNIAVLLMITISPSIYSQEEHQTRIGISSVMQDSQVDIMLPIKMEQFSIAPSLALIWSENIGTEVHLGIAPKVYLSTGKALPYFGAKVSFLIYSPNNRISVADYMVGLNGGGEYFFDTHFSMGVEAQMNITVSNEKSTRFGNPGKTNLNTATAIFATYYF